MLLESILERNLILIYNSENQSIHQDNFHIEKEGVYSTSQSIINELLNHDFIETEKDEKIFFLTTEGYDYVENLQKPITEKQQFPNDVFEIGQRAPLIALLDKNKLKKYTFIYLIIFALFLSIYLDKYPVKSEKERLNELIPDDVKKEMMLDVSKALDSIQ